MSKRKVRPAKGTGRAIRKVAEDATTQAMRVVEESEELRPLYGQPLDLRGGGPDLVLHTILKREGLSHPLIEQGRDPALALACIIDTAGAFLRSSWLWCNGATNRSQEFTLSMQPQPIDPIPEETARVAGAAFPKGNPYMRMRDELGVFYQDAQCAALFPVRGQPAESPWRVALVLVLQYAEGRSDQQAATAVRGRIDWKYALSPELSDPGFDASVRSECRGRWVAGSAEPLLLDTSLERFHAQGLLKARPPAHRFDGCPGGHPHAQSAGVRGGDVAPRLEQPGGRRPGLAAATARSRLGGALWPARGRVPLAQGPSRADGPGRADRPRWRPAADSHLCPDGSGVAAPGARGRDAAARLGAPVLRAPGGWHDPLAHGRRPAAGRPDDQLPPRPRGALHLQAQHLLDRRRDPAHRGLRARRPARDHARPEHARPRSRATARHPPRAGPQGAAARRASGRRRLPRRRDPGQQPTGAWRPGDRSRPPRPPMASTERRGLRCGLLHDPLGGATRLLPGRARQRPLVAEHRQPGPGDDRYPILRPELRGLPPACPLHHRPSRPPAECPPQGAASRLAGRAPVPGERGVPGALQRARGRGGHPLAGAAPLRVAPGPLHRRGQDPSAARPHRCGAQSRPCRSLARGPTLRPDTPRVLPAPRP